MNEAGEAPRSAWTEYLGCRTEEAGPGHARLVLLIERHHANRDGSVHGGVVSSLMDSAMGVALRASYGPEDSDFLGHATLEMNVSYLRAARLGERLTAEARLLRQGHSIVVGEVEVRDPSGDLAAKGRLTYFIHRQHQ